MLLSSWVQWQICQEVLMAKQKEAQWALGSQQSEKCESKRAPCPAGFWNTSSRMSTLKASSSRTEWCQHKAASPSPSGFPFWPVWESVSQRGIHRLLPSRTEPRGSLSFTASKKHGTMVPSAHPGRKRTNNDPNNKCTHSTAQTMRSIIIHSNLVSKTGWNNQYSWSQPPYNKTATLRDFYSVIPVYMNCIWLTHDCCSHLWRHLESYFLNCLYTKFHHF